MNSCSHFYSICCVPGTVPSALPVSVAKGWEPLLRPILQVGETRQLEVEQLRGFEPRQPGKSQTLTPLTVLLFPPDQDPQAYVPFAFLRGSYFPIDLLFAIWVLVRGQSPCQGEPHL